MSVFCSLYSSSSGNCTYIGTDAGGILIDIGVSAKRAEEALISIGVDPSSIAAVFVTHEHADHIGGVRVFAHRHGLKVYASRGTLDGMDEAGVFKSAVDAYIIPESGTEAAGIFVHPFRTSHDSYESTGFTAVTPDGRKFAVATDMGTVSDETAQALIGSDLVLLESNHDVGMLQNGPYPYYLKQRILSDRGHLSNEACSRFACALAESGTKHIVLGHLSKENNFPALAYRTTKVALDAEGACEGGDFFLSVAGDLNDPVIL